VQTAGGADAIVGAMQHREFTTTDETWADAPGVALLGDPIANRGTAFSAGERRELGLDGLLLSPSILRLPSMWRGLAMLLPFSLGLAVPAVGIGVATRYISATAAVTGSSGLLLVLLATVGALTVRSAPAPKPTPRS
jgi:hypothetical protein